MAAAALLLLPAPLANFQTWTTAGTRVAFVATSVGGKRGYLWTQTFGSASPRLLRSSPPIGLEEIDALAPGPNGSWAALQRAGGRVDVISSRGGGAPVATGVTQVFGDGTFLGYLKGAGVYRIGPGARSTKITDLFGQSVSQQAVVAAGTIAIRHVDGSVSVLTTGGRTLARIKANAASVALTANRVIVRTRARRLAVYGLRGGLVHNWPLAAASWTAGLGAYGRYAVYLGANKAVHSVTLVNGRDRVVARAGTGFYFDGVSLQAPGATVPLTTQRGKVFTTTLRFLPTAALG
jgi:hypothetical protein